MLGDAADDEGYEEDEVKEVGALAADGSALEVNRIYSHGRMSLEAPGAALIWTKSDYGFWRQTVRGWARGSRKSEGRTLQAAWHIQYAKLIRGSDRAAGLELEILLDEMSVDKLKGRVLYKGKPKSRAPLYLSHKKVARSGGEGRFELSRPEGRVVLTATVTEKLRDHPEVDKMVISSTLTLEATP